MAPRRPATTSVPTAILCIVGLALCPGIASAHPLLDEARSQSDKADFQQALLTLARAESESTLTRDDLVALYLQRALVHYALQLPGAMIADLERVAALEPNLELDANVPPGVREAFPTGEPLRLQLYAEPDTDAHAVRIRANVEGLRTDMVRDVVLGARVNEGDWRAGRGELELGANAGDHVEYHGAAFGPGGAPLATQGTREAPLSLVVPTPPGALPPPTPPPPSDESAISTTWWVVGGAAAAVATAVIVLLASGGEDSRTQLSGPEVSR